MRLGYATGSIPLNRWTGELPRTRGHWRVHCCVEGACEEVDWGWDVELVSEEEQEVVLALSLLLEWLILGFSGRHFFTVYDFMIFTTFYDFFSTDEELNK